MPPTDPTDRPEDASGGRGTRPDSSQTGGDSGSGAPEGSGKIDFGAFVSSRVKSSADRLKQGRGDTPGATSGSSASDPGAEPPSRPQSASRRRTQEMAPTTSRSRPQRYWRDAVPGEENDDPETATALDEGGSRRSSAAAGGGGGMAGEWYRRNGEGRPWFGSALIAAGVLALLLLVFLLTRLGGGGAEVTPAPTSAPVIQSSTTTPTERSVTQPAVNNPATETPRSGGDNQRRTNPAATGTPGVVGDVSKDCPERCLMRVTDAPQTSTLLSELGARPSFAGNGWQWVVATPEAIARIEKVDPSIVLVSNSADTLRLYAVSVPSDVKEDTAVSAFGTILDTIDRYRIVETESVPARVGPLTDTGYVVNKLTPASSSSQKGRTSDLPILTSIDIGTLTANVSVDNETTTVTSLQGMGAADGSAVGSRYYSLTGNQLAADYLYTELESYGAKVWYEDFITPDGLLLVNIVGELPGKDDLKMYGIMAHLDTTAAIPSVSPGADDNATGVAATLEIMRIFSGYQLNHPVRAIFTNAEDSGLLGSDAWAKRAVKEKTPVEGVFNIDSVGSTRKGETLIVNGDQKSAWMSDLITRVNDAYGTGQAINALQSSAIVADDTYVRAQGFESIMIARELFGESPFHHTANDVVENMSIPYTASATQVVLLSVASLLQ